MNAPTPRGRALAKRLLTQLFRNGQNCETIDVLELARRCGSDALAVARALRVLDEKGLVDARRLRLTFPGLALAVAFSRSGENVSPRRPGRTLPRARRAA